MKIPKYISQISAMFGKSGLLEDLRFARAHFVHINDTLERADKAFGSKFKSKEMQRVQQVFSGVVKTAGGKGIFGYLNANNKNILGTIDALEAICSGEFEDRIAAKGLNYRKANLVQLVDAITFTARYTTKLLNYALKHEVAATRVEKEMAAIDNTHSVPYEIEWISAGLIPYCTAIAIATKPADQMIDRLDAIPDILADENNYSNLKSTVGEIRLDPFLLGVSNFAWNPIRRIRMHAVEAKVKRAKEAEAELSMTKLRLIQLERTRAGKEDPLIEREITYLQSLSDSLTREIADLNED